MTIQADLRRSDRAVSGDPRTTRTSVRRVTKPIPENVVENSRNTNFASAGPWASNEPNGDHDNATNEPKWAGALGVMMKTP